MICFGLIYINLQWVAKHPKDHLLSQMHGEGQLILREILENYLGPVVLGVAVVLGLMSGVKAATEWESVLLYLNSTPFGTVDPQLGKDLGFYIFSLPFVHFVQSWLMGNLALKPARARSPAAACLPIPSLPRRCASADPARSRARCMRRN